MHCNLNTKLFYISSVLTSKVKAMADNTGREGEEALFEIIRSPNRPDDLNEANDGSEYLNNTGEGDMIFDRDDRIDEVVNYEHDEENVDLETTKTGEVYIFI